MNRIFLLLTITLGMLSCGNKATEIKQPKVILKAWNPPPAGTVVDEYKERIIQDGLDKVNEFYFKVTIKATDSSKLGYYALELEKGENKNETDLALPKWPDGSTLKPILKKGDKQYECLLGFDIGDGIFKEFYKIKVDEKGSIVMKQTMGYYH